MKIEVSELTEIPGGYKPQNRGRWGPIIKRLLELPPSQALCLELEAGESAHRIALYARLAVRYRKIRGITVLQRGDAVYLLRTGNSGNVP